MAASLSVDGEYQQQLSRKGLSKGDVLTIVGRSQAEVIPVYLAALQLGVVCSFTMPQPVARLEKSSSFGPLAISCGC